jgi:membrane protein implicated in regulation of membrane protease activity
MAERNITAIAWEPSNSWDGNDGLWNTFLVRVGTPAQDFRILPSTSGQELWLPDPAACKIISPSNPGYCGSIRGVLPVNGTNSPGFDKNISSTWHSEGLFTLTAIDSVIGYFGNGDYGTDTVAWGNDSMSPQLRNQIVASTANLQWWIGVAGLGPKAINLTSFQEHYDSYLSRLVEVDMIPSLSWAYTAGAAYRGRAPASLTLGGYDTSRFVAPGISLAMYADDSRPLTVAVTSMPAQNTLSGNIDLSSAGRYFLLDSAIPHIWVPQEDIPRWVAAFGLTYDNTTDLFLVNDTIHNQLRTLNPSITFTLAQYVDLPSGLSRQPQAVNITLPYAAFDLQASYPYYNNATNYFPIRRAANSTQYLIGRTFLQEAYIIADYDRGNFTVAQARPPSDAVPSQLVTIKQPSNIVELGSIGGGGSSSGLSAAATGGLLGGLAVLVLILAALVAMFIQRRRKQRRAQVSHENGVYHRAELGCDGPTLCEAPNDKSRLSAHDTESMSEADSGTQKSAEKKVEIHEMPGTPVGHESGLMAEIPGSEGVRPELEDIRKFSFERGREH